MWSRAFLDPFHLVDMMHRAQGSVLEALGNGPDEQDYDVAASGPLWTLRRYAGPEAGPVVLIVPAPIKRPYIWDLDPSVSVVRYCLQEGLRIYLLEWTPPTRENGPWGLSDYSDGAIQEAIAALSREIGSSKPFLMGHSLGGTFGAIFSILHPERLSGLVTLSAPLCLNPGVSAFRDSLVTRVPRWLTETDIVPGSFLTQLSAMTAPTTFVWSRHLDAAASSTAPRASNLRQRIERWALDEVPLSGKLLGEVFVRLYRENRLCGGSLEISGRTARPSDLRAPVLAVANMADDIAPPASSIPFVKAVGSAQGRVIECSGEVGVVLQHLGILVGREAFACIWPEIVSWIRMHNFAGNGADRRAPRSG